MEIENIWKGLGEEKSLSEGEIKKSLRPKNQDVLRKINRRLFWKIVTTVLFTPVYILLIFYMQAWFPQLLFALLALSHIYGLVFFIRRYQKARSLNMASGDILTTLKDYRENIRSTLRLEEWAGLVLYPIAASAGFFFSLMEKMTWEQVAKHQEIWLILLVTILVITPIAHLFARWLNRRTFGKLLKALEQRIGELEEA